ncbi:MAG: hypothetical protein DWQ42_05855 [Planctomycetota bacterium]|nr:MAG: hypothetical protein DWQ42_05855 [Planctomycetota bacterium]
MKSPFRRAWTAILLGLALVLGPVSTHAAELTASPSADTLVVCPQMLRPALEPWLRYRKQQGHVIEILDTRPDSRQLRQAIRGQANRKTLRAIVLVGDAVPERFHDEVVLDAAEQRRGVDGVDGKGPAFVPAHFAAAKVNVHFGGPPRLATDNWYANLDDDPLPDVAVGRLSVKTPAQLETVVEKIIAYETSSDFSAWRRRVHVVAGVGGFGALADSLIEGSTKWLLTSAIPPQYRVTMTYGNWRSPYCPPPSRFGDHAIGRLNQGSLLWVYIGHGLPRQLDYVVAGDRSYPIFDVGDLDRVSCPHGAPIAAFLSCYAGAFDLDGDCLGEELLRRPAGPVAVIASSRVALPYGLGVLGTEMLSQTFDARCETLGEVVLKAKRRSLRTASFDMRRRTLDTIAQAISPVEATPEEERREHVDLVNLLGDPLLRIPQAKKIELDLPRRAIVGDTITVRLESPIAGEATVELVARRDRLRVPFTPRQRFEATPAALASYEETYRQANQPAYTRRSALVEPGLTEFELTLPEEAHGSCHLQVYVRGEQDFAMGSADISIRRPLQEKAPAAPDAAADGAN